MRRAATSFLLPIALDPKSSTPLYHQLSEWFRRAIVMGQLKPGQRVPSTRNLATELKVSRIPVLNAYEQLHAEGYLETFTGAGTCVARAIPDGALKAVRPRKPIARSAVAAKPRYLSRRAQAVPVPLRPWLKNLGPCRVGLPALDQFPAGVWAKLVNRHARKPPIEELAYGETMGHLPFREAIAEYLATVRAVRCDASQILITTGSQQGLLIAAHVLLDAKDRVWMEEPGYPGAHQTLAMVGAEVVPVPVDQEGLVVAEGLRRARDARAAYITPSHQFPMGMTMSAARRMQLLNWAVESGGWIIEDDYDSEYRFGGRPLASLQGLDTDDRVIYLGTFSKVMFPALRLGYVVIPKDLVPAFASTRDATDTFSSTFFQAVMTDFIRQGHFARHIRRMRTLYMERRSALVETLREQLGDDVEVVGAEAGMQLTVLLPSGMDDVAVSLEAGRRGVSARPLSACYLKPPQRGGLILGYGGAGVKETEAAVRALKQALAAVG